MVSKCRNIWDTLRGDVSSISCPTFSYCADTVSAKPSSCQAKQQPLASNSSRRNSGVRGEKNDHKHQHDALKTSEQCCWSLNPGQSCLAVLETVCLHENEESSSSNLTASNSRNTDVSVPSAVFPSVLTTTLCRSRDVMCSRGKDSLVQISRLSVHHRDTNVVPGASLTAEASSISASPSTDQLNAGQMQGIGFSGETNSHSVQLSHVKVSSTNHTNAGTVPERRKQSSVCGVSDSWKANKRATSQGGVNESFIKNYTTDLLSVNVDVERSVDQTRGALSFFDHLLVPDIILSAARTELDAAHTKPEQQKLHTGHDTNSATDKNSLTDRMKRSRTALVPVLGSSYSLNFFKCRSPGADIKTESLSDVSEIPLFSSPFEAVTVNDNSSFDSRVPVVVGSTLAKGPPLEGICDLLSSVICSNLSASYISQTSLSDILENRMNGSATNGVVQVNDLGCADGQAVPRVMTDSTNLTGSTDVCDDAKVNSYVTMLENNAYRKLQYFYTSGKNMNSLSFPISKPHPDVLPDCCDEGFVESPMTTDDVVESLSDLGAVGSSQMPVKVLDSDVFEAARTLTNDETDTEFASDEIRSAVEGVLGWLEADTLRETNALLETNAKREMNVLPNPDEEKQTELLTGTLHDHDHSKSDNESVERTRMSKRENAVEVSMKTDVLEVDSSSLSFMGEDMTVSEESRVADITSHSGNSVHNFANGMLSKDNSLFAPVGMDHEIGISNLDANPVETDSSQCDAKTTFQPLERSKTKNLSETEPIGICSKMLPTLSEPRTAVCFSCSRISEKALSPCILETSKYFTSALTLPSQDRLCSSTNMAKVCCVQNLNDPCRAWQNDGPFEIQEAGSILLPDFQMNYDLLRGNEYDGCHSNGGSAWEDKSCDTFSETSRGRSEEEPADCKAEKCNDLASKRNRKISRQPRLLNEIANTVGFIADKRHNQRSDNLFIDSKLLSREERVLQMVHMQITKMEVKAELTKLKKIKSFSETTEQDNKSERGGQKSDRHCPATRRQVRRRIKANRGRASKGSQLFSRSQKLHNKRIRQRNIWSSRAIRFTELRSVAMPREGVKSCWAEWKKPTTSMKSRMALGTSHGGQFLIQNKTGSRGLGRWRSTASDDVDRKFAADAELLTLKNSTSMGRLVSAFDLDAVSKRTDCSSDQFTSVTKQARSEDVSHSANHFSSAEYSQGHATPAVPLEVKRLIACHNTGETVLHKAARLGYPEIVLWCCQSRYVDIDATDNAGYTPLHESCIGSEVCIAKYLLHYGANVNIASGVDGRRPIHEAVDSDSLEMVRLLLSAGADINLATYSGKTVQDMAKSPEMKEFIKAYLDDLNDLKGGNEEVVWDLAPVWNDVADKRGMDLFCDVPLSDPKSEEFYVECSHRLL